MIRNFTLLAFFTVAPLWGAQYALPDANNGTTNWTQGAGDGDGDWFDELDEGFGAGRGSGSGPDGLTTRWESPNNPVNEDIATALSTVTDPLVSTGHLYRTENRKSLVDGRQIDIVIELSESSTTIATQSFVDIGPVFTTRSDTLSAGEADAIGNYANLEIHTSANVVGGGPGREGWESAHEFECPDVAPTLTQAPFINFPLTYD